MLMRKTSSPTRKAMPFGGTSRLIRTAMGLTLGLSVSVLAGCSLFQGGDQTITATNDMTSGAWNDVEDEAPRIAPPPPKNTIRNDIVAVVNDHPISSYDLEQRTRLIMVTSGIPNTAQMRQKVRQQALEKLITESLQRQEAQKDEMTVSSVDVNKRIKEIMTDSHLDMDQLHTLLKRGGVSMAAFRSQIASELLWQRVVQQQYSGRINISPDTVDAQMKRIAESANKVHYAVSEIFVAVDNPDQDARAKQNAESYYEQIKAGAPFQAIARQFSQSPSAAQGGSIGVVYDGQLAPELNKALSEMKTGEVSHPIRAIGGYYILALQQRYEPFGTKVESQDPEDQSLPAELPLGRLLLPLPSDASAELKDNAMKIARALEEHNLSCEVMPKVAKEIQGSVYMDLGKVRMADLSASIRKQIAKARPGEVVPPFFSDAGLEIFVRCDKRIPIVRTFHMPTRDEVESQLFSEQISAMARRFDRDLKRNADIEIKDPEFKEAANATVEVAKPVENAAPKAAAAGKGPAPKAKGSKKAPPPEENATAPEGSPEDE